METMIVYVDDAAYAKKMLLPMLPAGTAQHQTHWIVMGCTPPVTHDISKWVSPEALALWRDDWGKELFAQIMPLLQRPGDTVTTQLASHKLPLIAQTEALAAQHDGAQVLDARRPKFGQDLEPVSAAQPQEHNRLVSYVAAVASAGLLVALD
ncbi:MAG: hypothetical protein Q7K57_31530 [Burkholderiaceae bacterium]|nr:hypothetical protein [Burkholderiaceae bacterium]